MLLLNVIGFFTVFWFWIMASEPTGINTAWLKTPTWITDSQRDCLVGCWARVNTALEPRTTSLKKAPRTEKSDNIKKFLEFMPEKSFAVKLQQKAI